MIQNLLPKQPEVNIGTLGHVDNGKSTLVQAMTGIWTSKHSEEIKRGITIRIGYADAAFYKCAKCGNYINKEICPKCNTSGEFLRAVSFVDCPGHHSLMVTMLAGASLMDGALLILSATEKCPQPQDREHLAAAQIVGIDKIVIVQNKIDVVEREQIVENYNQIQDFIEGTIIENAPIIPVSAQQSTNIDVLIEAIEKNIPTPKKDPTKPPIMPILRSFDVNRPGTSAEQLLGGVIGGSILEGVFKVGNKVEIKPGIRIEKKGKTHYEPVYTEIISLQAGGRDVNEATPGGLIGVGTLLDPSLTKADGFVGNVVGKPNKMPPVLDHLSLDIELFEMIIGTKILKNVEKIRTNEALVINTGTTVTAGLVTSARENVIDISLRRPICVELNSRLALSRRVGDSWRLIGHGIIKS
jgi:translation initiation factor 2 subunit 3